MIVWLALNINFWMSLPSSVCGICVEQERKWKLRKFSGKPLLTPPAQSSMCMCLAVIVCILTTDNRSYYQAISLHSGTKSSPLENNAYTYLPTMVWSGKCEKFSTSSHAHRMWPSWVKINVCVNFWCGSLVQTLDHPKQVGFWGCMTLVGSWYLIISFASR